MSVFLQPLQTVTVGSGGASSVTFSNIPQTYTDLLIKISARATIAAISDSIAIYPNGSSSNLSETYIQGNGSSASSFRDSYCVVRTSGSSATSNTFSNSEIYIPNYTSSNYKSMILESTAENNATTEYFGLGAGLWSNTAAITSLQLYQLSGTNFVQYSEFSLYGILRQGI